MTLDFRNTNTLWASVLVETLVRLGLEAAVISPGSRSTALTMALAAHPQVAAIPVLDERSAAFWGLGLAKRSGRPVALVCTSGTAGANYYPAVIEAYESQVPLLLLTADRRRSCATAPPARPSTSKSCLAALCMPRLSWRCRRPSWRSCATCGRR